MTLAGLLVFALFALVIVLLAGLFLRLLGADLQTQRVVYAIVGLLLLISLLNQIGVMGDPVLRLH